jgi:hypothetical protein
VLVPSSAAAQLGVLRDGGVGSPSAPDLFSGGGGFVLQPPGVILERPQIQIVFWGRAPDGNWLLNSQYAPMAVYTSAMLASLLQDQDVGFMSALSKFNTPTQAIVPFAPNWGRGVNLTLFNTSLVLSDADIRTELEKQAAAGALTTALERLFVVYFPPQIQINLGGPGVSCDNWYGYHQYDDPLKAAYIVAPICDLNESGFERTVSHELAEAMTDPTAGGGWVDPYCLCEIADLCPSPWFTFVTYGGVTPVTAYSISTFWSDPAPTSGCVAYAGMHSRRRVQLHP